MYTILVLTAVFISGLIIGACAALMILRFVSSTRKSMKRNRPNKIPQMGGKSTAVRLKKVV
jgi:hypothetical protein